LPTIVSGDKNVTGFGGSGYETEATSMLVVRVLSKPADNVVEGQQPIQNVSGVTSSDIVAVPLAAVGVIQTCLSGLLPGIFGTKPVNVPHEIVTFEYAIPEIA